MKTYHWNTENWYERNWSVLQHIRTWLVWIGGWEKANGAGWEISYKAGKRLRIHNITPISFFGHRITFFGWGGQVKMRDRYLVWTKESGCLQMFLSPNGTPSCATTWLRGTPQHIVDKVSERRTSE